MTVTYSLEVSQAHLGGFARLLLRWRGSIYKLVYRELFIFMALHYMIMVMYRFLLSDIGRTVFEEMKLYCETFSEVIPMAFVMAFYVAIVVGRWWQYYLNLPWPDRCAITIATYIQGSDDRGRMIRRTLVRYLNLMAVLALQGCSTVIKLRFPTEFHIVQAGFMTEEELSAMQATLCRHANYFIPGCWFAQLAMQARKEGRIHDDFHLKTIIDEMQEYRGNCGTLFSYDWISVPLVYTQVVTISVYTYFATVLLARQVVYKDPSPGNWNGTQSGERSFGSAIYSVEFYFPVFTMLQFFFYMGWLKVAEQLINPLGEDDDDFEVNYLVDRNVQVGFLIVDDLYGKYPPLQRDVFWDTAEPEVPYTTATVETKINPFLGSTIDVSMPPGDMDWAPMFSGSGHPSPPDSPGSPVDAERHSAGSATPVSRPRHILRRFFSRGGSKRSLLTGSRLSIHRRSNLSSQKSLQILNDKRLPSVVISSRQGSRYGSRSSVNSSLQDDLVPFGSYSSVVASPDGVLPNNLPVPQPSLADPTPVANHVAPPAPQGPTPAPAPPQPEQPPAYNYSYNDEPLPAIAEEEPKPEDVADSGTDPGTQKGSPDPPSDMTAAVDETEGNGDKTPLLVDRTQAGDGQTDVTHGQTQGQTDETPTHHVEQQPLLPSDSAMNPTV